MGFIDSFSRFSKKPTEIDEKKIIASIVMNSPTVPKSLSIEEAIDVLQKSKQTGVPVTNESGKLVGFFSEKDCLRYLYGAFYFNQIGSPVEKFMNQQVVAIKEDFSVTDILKLFIENPFHVYPVVDKENILIGTISRSDLLSEIYAIMDVMFEQSSAA
jgi:CBS domain-containing protein